MTSAAPITATRRGGLVLVVVELIPVLAALASAAAGALLRLRRLDRVRELLQREPDAPLVGIDADDEQRELVADADDLVGPVDRPVRHLRDVQEAVHAGLELDERPEVREPAHLARDARAGVVALLDRRPRVGLDLLHSERDALAGAVDVEDDHVDLVADVHQLRWVTHAARPRHLRDVDEPLDAGLQLDEGAVIGEAHHLATGLRARRERLLDALPGVRRLLLVAERDAARLAIEVQHDHLDLVADLEDLRRVPHAAPAHVGDVQEPVDAAQVDERAVVRDVLHGARERHALREDLERVLLLLLALLLEDRPPGEHDVAAAPVQLDHLRADRLPDHRGEVLHGPEVHLRAGEEGLHAHVHRQAALDDLHDPALDRQPLVVGLSDRVPHLDLVGLVLREDDQPLGVLLRLEVDLDVVADLGELAVTMKLLDGDRALALVADVHEDLRRGHLDDAAPYDLALLELAGGPLVEPVVHPLLGRVLS